MPCKRCGSETPQNALYCPFCGRRVNYTPKTKKRGNGQGTAFKRGSTWTAQVTAYTFVNENGRLAKKYKTKGGFKTKKEALAYLEALRQAETRKMPTLLELYSVWEKNDLPKLSKDKQTAYKKARERIESIVGRKIDTLTTADLQKVVSDNASTYYTARDIKTLLSHLYKRACADQFVPSNITKYIVLPKLEESEPIPFNEDEVAKMWTAYEKGDTFVGFMLIMIYSGMMPGELLSCKKAMIDFERCEIYGCGKKTKTRKESPIVFADIVKPIIAELCDKCNEKLYEKCESEFYDEYHKATARIGIRDLPPYSCRHTTGTEVAKQNINAPTIQKIMRHAKITTSQKYIHLGTDEAHDGVNSMTNG